MNEEDQSFIKKTKRTLDQGTEQLPAGIQSQLTRMRHEALDTGERRRGWDWMGFPVQAAGLATVAVLAVFLYFKAPADRPMNFEDIDLLTSEDNLELYEELEFYAWLAEEEANAG